MRSPRLPYPITRGQGLAAMLGLAVGLSAPTRVFVAISGDLLQLASVAVPLIIAILILLATTSFAPTPHLPEQTIANLSRRRFSIAEHQVSALQAYFGLIAIDVVAKFFCVWFVGRGWLGWIVDHAGAALTIEMAVFAASRSRRLLFDYQYLLTERDITAP